MSLFPPLVSVDKVSDQCGATWDERRWWRTRRVECHEDAAWHIFWRMRDGMWEVSSVCWTHYYAHRTHHVFYASHPLAKDICHHPNVRYDDKNNRCVVVQFAQAVQTTATTSTS